MPALKVLLESYWYATDQYRVMNGIIRCYDDIRKVPTSPRQREDFLELLVIGGVRRVTFQMEGPAFEKEQHFKEPGLVHIVERVEDRSDEGQMWLS